MLFSKYPGNHMCAATDPAGKQAWLDLVSILPYIEIDGKISASSLGNILEKLDIQAGRPDLKVKGIWHQFKQFHVYNNADVPLFFIKELWQPEFLREIIGLHVGINFVDPELCMKKYMFGKWKQESGKEKPILITTYVKGQPLKKNQIESFKFELGRQHAFHAVLSLYDVDWRHFIIQQGILVRIDFGKSFDNMNIPYQGFWDLKWNQLKNDPAFREGINSEFGRIKERVATEKRHIAYLINKLDSIGHFRNFFIDFDVQDFVARLRKYWANHLPFPIV